MALGQASEMWLLKVGSILLKYLGTVATLILYKAFAVIIWKQLNGTGRIQITVANVVDHLPKLRRNYCYLALRVFIPSSCVEMVLSIGPLFPSVKSLLIGKESLSSEHQMINEEQVARVRIASCQEQHSQFGGRSRCRVQNIGHLVVVAASQESDDLNSDTHIFSFAPYHWGKSSLELRSHCLRKAASFHCIASFLAFE